MKSERQFSFGQKAVLAIVPALVACLLRVVGWTLRFKVIAEEGAIPADIPGRGIFCFWHQCTLACTYYFRKYHAVILISSSFDGEMITRVLRLFGYGAVRGSSSRGGREGLLGLKAQWEQGRKVIFTADGPRGPIYQTKMGPVKLAQMTGEAIGSFYLLPERAWEMRSWDRFAIPKPFSRVWVSWAREVHVPADADEEMLRAKRQELNDALERARLAAEAHATKAGKRRS